MFGLRQDEGKRAAGEQKLRCSFCDKRQDAVRKLIAGPTAYICDECVSVCVDIITDDARTQAAPPDPGKPLIRAGEPPRWSATARCTLCRMPLVLEESVSIESRGVLCMECVSEVQAAAARLTGANEPPEGEP